MHGGWIRTRWLESRGAEGKNAHTAHAPGLQALVAAQDLSSLPSRIEKQCPSGECLIPQGPHDGTREHWGCTPPLCGILGLE